MKKAKEVIKVTLFFSVTLLVIMYCSKKESSADSMTKPGSQGEWINLFDGQSLDGWMMTKENGWSIEDGVLTRSSGGNIWTNKRYGNFILDCEFKMSPKCNSGIFFRTDDINDYVQTGIEVQVLDSYGKTEIDKHDCGAVYDCLEPSVNAAKPAGEWNHVVITCNDNMIKIVLNDVPIIDMDLDKWTEPNMNPDGTKNKFNTAMKDFAREGHIGFQDHGHPVWYRNVKIKEL